MEENIKILFHQLEVQNLENMFSKCYLEIKFKYHLLPPLSIFYVSKVILV